METTYQLARTRVKTNAHRINQFEYLFYEELVNMRTKRYQLMLNMYAEVQVCVTFFYKKKYIFYIKCVTDLADRAFTYNWSYISFC